MPFNQGKEQYYERVMQEKPNNNKGNCNKPRKYAPFRYKFKDVDCKYCIYRGKCKFEICPVIMENHDDLLHDGDFTEALENAEQCKNAQKTTLITLKEWYREAVL